MIINKISSSGFQLDTTFQKEMHIKYTLKFPYICNKTKKKTQHTYGN